MVLLLRGLEDNLRNFGYPDVLFSAVLTQTFISQPEGMSMRSLDLLFGIDLPEREWSKRLSVRKQKIAQILKAHDHTSPAALKTKFVAKFDINFALDCLRHFLESEEPSIDCDLISLREDCLKDLLSYELSAKSWNLLGASAFQRTARFSSPASIRPQVSEEEIIYRTFYLDQERKLPQFPPKELLTAVSQAQLQINHLLTSLSKSATPKSTTLPSAPISSLPVTPIFPSVVRVEDDLIDPSFSSPSSSEGPPSTNTRVDQGREEFRLAEEMSRPDNYLHRVLHGCI